MLFSLLPTLPNIPIKKPVLLKTNKLEKLGKAQEDNLFKQIIYLLRLFPFGMNYLAKGLFLLGMEPFLIWATIPNVR